MTVSSDYRIVFSSFPKPIEEIRADSVFFTDKDEPANPIFLKIVNAINNRGVFSFADSTSIRLLEMRNVIYILNRKRDLKPVEILGSTFVAIQFTFTNIEPVTIECDFKASDVESIDGTISNILLKCKTIGKALTFSNDHETIIINRRFLSSILVKKY